MTVRQIIARLDVSEGRVVVRTPEGDVEDTGAPAELARFLAGAGADALLVLDISAAQGKAETLVGLVEAITREVFIPVLIGGGIESVKSIGPLLRAGADKVVINSAALRNPSLIDDASARYGAHRVTLAIDAKRKNGAYEVYSHHGGTKPTGRDPASWGQEAVARGAGELLLRSIDHQGTHAGFATELINEVADVVSVPLIVSGGAGACDHFVDVFTCTPAWGAIAAAIFHRKETSVKRVKRQCMEAGITLRPPPGLEDEAADRARATPTSTTNVSPNGTA